MVATVVGTQAITWTGKDPTPTDAVIPATTTAVYMFWSYFDGNDGVGLLSATLGGVSLHADSFELAGGTPNNANPTGCAIWYSPSTGNQSLDVSYDGTPAEGPCTILAYVKDGDNTAGPRDTQTDHGVGGTAVSVTVTTVSGDLVLCFDRKYAGTPGTIATFTSLLTMTNNNGGVRLSSKEATGTSVICPSQNEDYSSMCALSIPAGTAAAVPQIIQQL